jgi:hypothetical protein
MTRLVCQCTMHCRNPLPVGSLPGVRNMNNLPAAPLCMPCNAMWGRHEFVAHSFAAVPPFWTLLGALRHMLLHACHMAEH